MNDPHNQKLLILLVDDDATTNFLHRRAISKATAQVEVHEALNGQLAIEQLKVWLKQGVEPPQYIFLDINMPQLDGWGFLESYRKLPSEWRSNAKLYMLTTSLNPDDHERASGYPEVIGIVDKMLSSERFTALMSEQHDN